MIFLKLHFPSLLIPKRGLLINVSIFIEIIMNNVSLAVHVFLLKIRLNNIQIGFQGVKSILSKNELTDIIKLNVCDSVSVAKWIFRTLFCFWPVQNTVIQLFLIKYKTVLYI